jgi:hypothetical protein
MTFSAVDRKLRRSPTLPEASRQEVGIGIRDLSLTGKFVEHEIGFATFHHPLRRWGDIFPIPLVPLIAHSNVRPEMAAIPRLPLMDDHASQCVSQHYCAIIFLGQSQFQLRFEEYRIIPFALGIVKTQYVNDEDARMSKQM